MLRLDQLPYDIHRFTCYSEYPNGSIHNGVYGSAGGYTDLISACSPSPPSDEGYSTLEEKPIQQEMIASLGNGTGSNFYNGNTKREDNSSDIEIPEPDSTIKSPISDTVSSANNQDNNSQEVTKKHHKSSKRTIFSKRQLVALETRFIQQSFLCKEERRELADELDITERQIMIWFQNRRGRLKKRGSADTAYNPLKLNELHTRRPYPFLYGMLSTMHYQHSGSHQDKVWSLYPDEVRSVVPTPEQKGRHLENSSREQAVSPAASSDESTGFSPRQTDQHNLCATVTQMSLPNTNNQDSLQQCQPHMPPNVVMNSSEMPKHILDNFKARTGRHAQRQAAYNSYGTRRWAPYSVAFANYGRMSQSQVEYTSFPVPGQSTAQGYEQNMQQTHYSGAASQTYHSAYPTNSYQSQSLPKQYMYPYAYPTAVSNAGSHQEQSYDPRSCLYGNQTTAYATMPTQMVNCPDNTGNINHFFPGVIATSTNMSSGTA